MKEVIEIWPSAAQLARELVARGHFKGTEYPSGTVRLWKYNGIPAQYDLDIVALANARGVPLTYEHLAKMRAGKRVKIPSAVEQ